MSVSDYHLPADIPSSWRELLLAIPGYDAIATAGDALFDEKSARKVLDFFHECLKHVEGEMAGRPFALEVWQQAIIANLFGWKRKDTRGRWVRRYRESLIYVPRKNGKTPLAAGIVLYGLFCDNEAGAQIVSAAADQEQAALLYRHARGMIEQEMELAQRAKIYTALKSIVLRADPASAYKALSAEAHTKHGGNLHLAVIDELHAQPNRELVDVIQTSMASANRAQPLLVHITTADFQRESICNEKHDYACKVRDGILADPSFLPVIYEALVEEDWKDPKVWARANPNLGVSVSLEYLERECKRAQEIPAYENTFKRLHLNMKTEQDVRAVPMDQWELCGKVPVDPKALEGRECYGGLDLASTTDIAAFVLAFPKVDPNSEEPAGYHLLPFFWVPKENARRREKRDRVPYETWIRQGFIKATEGNVIDYDVIRADINALRERYNIVSADLDRWNATQIAVQLQGDGLLVEFCGQGFASLTAPTKEFLRLIADSKLWHGNHPVLRWMASNMATESDAAGNLKPSKKKSGEKIDGCVGAIMAIGRAMVRGDGDEWYTPGCLTD